MLARNAVNFKSKHPTTASRDAPLALRNEIDSADVFEDFVQEALPTLDLGRDRGFRATKVKRWIAASSDHV